MYINENVGVKQEKFLVEQIPSDKFITGFNEKYANNVLGILN